MTNARQTPTRIRYSNNDASEYSVWRICITYREPQRPEPSVAVMYGSVLRGGAFGATAIATTNDATERPCVMNCEKASTARANVMLPSAPSGGPTMAEMSMRPSEIRESVPNEMRCRSVRRSSAILWSCDVLGRYCSRSSFPAGMVVVAAAVAATSLSEQHPC